MTSFRSLAVNRDFTALWSAATVAELGTRISTFAMPLVAYALTGSAFWAAAAEAVYLVGTVLTLLPAGVLTDRLDRRQIMRLAHGTGALMYLSLAAAGIAGMLSLPHLLVAAAATGIATGLFEPAENASVRSIVSTEELPTALSQSQARQHIAGLLGGPIGGALFGLVRWAPFAANTVAYVVGWILLGRIRRDLSPTGTADAARPFGELTEGLRFIWTRPLFRVMLMWNPMLNLALNALLFLALLRLIEAGFPGWQLGLAEAAVGGAGVLGALVAPRIIERFRTGSLVIAVGWIFVPLALPLAFWNHPVTLAVAAGVGIFFLPSSNAGMGAYRTAVTPPALLGRVMSANFFMSMLSMPLAPVLAGALLASLGGRDAVLTLAGVIAVVALIPTLSGSVRAVPRPSEWRAESAAEPVAVPSGA